MPQLYPGDKSFTRDIITLGMIAYSRSSASEAVGILFVVYFCCFFLINKFVAAACIYFLMVFKIQKDV